MTTEVATITVADVDASIARVIQSAESIWDEWAWQVENETWLIKGYASWDEMRRAVYGGLSSVTAPRAERPELVARFRRAGLTQKQTAETLGVSRRTIQTHDEPTYEKRSSALSTPDPDVIDAEVVEDDEDDAPQGYVNTQTGEITNTPRRTPRTRTDTESDLALINDLRGPWSQGLTKAARHMTPTARAHIIDALQNTLNKIKEMDQ